MIADCGEGSRCGALERLSNETVAPPLRIMWLRRITGALWRFYWFRWLTLWLGLRGWCLWFLRNTPLFVALRELALRGGRLDGALELGAMLRQWGDL